MSIPQRRTYEKACVHSELSITISSPRRVPTGGGRLRQLLGVLRLQRHQGIAAECTWNDPPILHLGQEMITIL